MPLLEEAETGPFNAITDNCSDFVAGALLTVFGDSGFRMRSRLLHVADAWITTPLAIATDFVNYVRRERVPFNVEFQCLCWRVHGGPLPESSISRGALVPDASQGKMAFSLKIYFNTLNPLLGLTAFGTDKASRFADLPGLVHERGSGELSRMANEMAFESGPERGKAVQVGREQAKTFGATSCWKNRQDQFAAIEDQAVELALMSRVERRLLLRYGQPYVLPRLYEKTAAARGYEGVLMAGLRNCTVAGCDSLGSSFLPDLADPDAESSGSPTGFVSSRPEIQAMAVSDKPGSRVMALKLMTALINYDLSSSPLHRRPTASFDPDWKLYLDVAAKNGISASAADATVETVAECSCRAFDAHPTNTDVLTNDRSLRERLAREGRGVIYGANR